MDAAVVGIPRILHPAIDERDAVADWLNRFDVSGFSVPRDPIDVLDAVVDPPDAPAFENYAAVIAWRVTTDLRDPDPYATASVGVVASRRAPESRPDPRSREARAPSSRHSTLMTGRLLVLAL